jgi:REP element-mobilizing transposase RayT
MPRIARGVAVSYPHHIVQRGNNREKVFFHDKDKEKYLTLLKKYAEKWNVRILAYCLMSTHVHLLAKPLEDISLFKMMQGVTLCLPSMPTGHTKEQEGYGKADTIPALLTRIDISGQSQGT